MTKIRKLIVAVAGLAVVLGVDNAVVDAVASVATALAVYFVPND